MSAEGGQPINSTNVLESLETLDVEEESSGLECNQILSDDAGMSKKAFDGTASASTVIQGEGPHQPLLKSYDRKIYQNESRDFNPQLFKKYPWASFHTSLKCIKVLCMSKILIRPLISV